MAISAEAMEYLHELERTPNWTKIPNEDERILKLRALFNVDLSEERESYKRKKVFNRKGTSYFQVKAIVDGAETIYPSANKCAQALGIGVAYVHQRSRTGGSHKGMYFERIEWEE